MLFGAGKRSRIRFCFDAYKFNKHLDLPTTRIEYNYYLMARDSGMEMIQSVLIEGEKEMHFLTERFGRKGNERIHVQTLAAMNPVTDSYESLFDLTCRIGTMPIEMQRLFLPMTMNVLGGNVDDHNKNFNFMMGQDGVWHITPTCDLTFSVDPLTPGYINRHCMTINNKNSAFERGNLLEVAKIADSLIEKAIDVASDYQRYAHIAGVDGYLSHQIKKGNDSSYGDTIRPIAKSHKYSVMPIKKWTLLKKQKNSSC